MHFRSDWTVPKTRLKTFFQIFQKNTKILKYFMKYFMGKNMFFNISSCDQQTHDIDQATSVTIGSILMFRSLKVK